MTVSTVEQPDVRVLIDAETIRRRVAELGAEISRDFAGARPTLVCILKGSMPFFVDLARAITLPVRYDYLAVSSYDGTESSGVVRFTSDLSDSIEGRHVLVVEDIVDTGLTMNYLFDALAARHPASLSLATLLDKPSRRKAPVDIRYRGFEIPDEFVVGYGLDFNQYFRNLPDVCVLQSLPSP